MDLKPKDSPTDERTEACPADRVDDLAPPTPESRPQIRPEVLKVFNARWKRNEPAYRFLAEH
ncbi:MAG: hypothetical protein ABI353_07815 [Isosphaeraceae bacterium]